MTGVSGERTQSDCLSPGDDPEDERSPRPRLCRDGLVALGRGRSQAFRPAPGEGMGLSGRPPRAWLLLWTSKRLELPLFQVPLFADCLGLPGDNGLKVVNSTKIDR